MSASSQLTGITLWISSPASPKDSVEIAASAKTIGARIRRTPPAIVPIQLTKIAPIGNRQQQRHQPSPRRASRSGSRRCIMFCIQASRPSGMIAAIEIISGAAREERLAREDGQDLRDRSERRQQEDQVAAGEEDPAQVLVEDRRAALAGVEEDAAEVAVDLQHDQRREHRRSGDDQHPAGDGAREAEGGEPPPGHAGRPQLRERHGEVDRLQDEAEDGQADGGDPDVDAVVRDEGRVRERAARR